MDKESINIVRKIKNRASTISGDLVDPATEGKIRHAKDCAADIHKLASDLEQRLQSTGSAPDPTQP